ncbi:MAG: SurA N-terminal domain-containing protein [Bacteroidaceae bacterium]|jgi:peptidyl-prolyl cis-trans isomerase D|nr:SurA N-terminal domain-containing protein [Bacteroidaceae bacterium]
MAALQKIRSKGVLLVTIIAVALFLFVAGDLFRGLESLFQKSSQQVGEVDGKSISIQDYQKLVDDMQTYYEIAQQKSSFSEDELNRIKDEAWQTYVQQQLIQTQCEKLGLAVSDAEISDIVKTGFSQMLQVPVFMNQQTGRYDFAMVNQFLSEYKKLKESGTQIPETYEKIYKYYLFAQRQIRDQLLTQKYQVLLSQCFLSNPVEAKLVYEGRAEESDLLLAAIPAASVKDDDVKVTDEELTAKYNEDKEQYQQFIETRDVKIIDVAVVASDADKKVTEKEMADAASKLAAATSNAAAGNVTRQAASLLPYSDVYKSKDAFPSMISSTLDSTAVGVVKTPSFDPMTNTYYTYKVLGKTTQPDSVLFRQLGVIGKDEADIAKKADSIMTALSAGANFKDIAKKYNQEGDSSWVATAQYQGAALDADNSLYINTIFGMNGGETKKLKLENGSTIILQVLKTANPVMKYNVAAVVKELKFSDDTYSKEYNKFSSFVAENNTLEKIEANAAKSGYTVRPLNDLAASAHGIAGIRATRDALKWVFDEAKEGDVSPLYECGSNDHLLLVALTGVNKEGYRSQEKLKDELTEMVKTEKKIAKIYESAKNVKSMADARKLKDVVVDTIKHVSFSAPAFIASTGASEPLVSALAAKTAKGAFAGPVKGNNGVYMIQVINKTKTDEKFDEKAEESTIAMGNFRNASSTIINSLYMKAKVKDNRYKFF